MVSRWTGVLTLESVKADFGTAIVSIFSLEVNQMAGVRFRNKYVRGKIVPTRRGQIVDADVFKPRS